MSRSLYRAQKPRLIGANPPGTLGKIDRVFFGTCAPSPYVIAWSASAALLQAWISFVRPNLKVGVELAAGTSWLHHAKQVMQDAYPAEATYQRAYVSSVFSLARAADVASYFIWLADMASDLLTNFSSQAWSLSGCQYSPHDVGYSNRGQGAITTDGNFHAAAEWIIDSDQSQFAPVWGCNIQIDPGGQCTITAALQAYDFYGLELDLTVQVIEETTGQVFASDTITADEIAAGGAATISTGLLGSALGQGGSFYLQASSPPGRAFEAEAFLSGFVDLYATKVV